MFIIILDLYTLINYNNLLHFILHCVSIVHENIDIRISIQD
jgi:hypothetical protein